MHKWHSGTCKKGTARLCMREPAETALIGWHPKSLWGSLAHVVRQWWKHVSMWCGCMPAGGKLVAHDCGAHRLTAGDMGGHPASVGQQRRPRPLCGPRRLEQLGPTGGAILPFEHCRTHSDGGGGCDHAKQPTLVCSSMPLCCFSAD